MNKNLDDIYILDIIVDTTADGPGLRTAIYSAGCSHKCIGCHNPTSWNISNGKKMYINEVIEYITKLDRNITFSGGDPFFQVNAFTKLASVIKKRTNKNIWCYTGYTFEELIMDSEKRELLNYIDVLVDGRFEEKYKNNSLIFKGSENQRIIDIPKSIINNKVILYNYNPLPSFVREF